MRAMSLPEVIYRTRQVAVAKLEKTREHRSNGREPVEAFLRRQRLPVNGDHAYAKYTEAILQDFRNRDVFVWQFIDRDALRELFNYEFVLNKVQCYQAAENILKHRFKVFDRQISFNGPVNWHYDVLQHRSIPLRHWTEMNYYDANVVSEVKYVWELNRHQHFVTLARAYLLRDQEHLARELFQQWQHWIESNPFHQGLNWTSSLEMALRLISWTWALQMAKQSHYLTADLFIKILQSIEQHARHICTHLSRYSSANNHLLGEALGLIYAGVYYPELHESAKWQNMGFDILFHHFPAQVHADGVIKEQSDYYLRYLFDYGVLAKMAADYCNLSVPEKFLLTLQRMAEWLRAIMDDAGHVPMLGDEDGGQAIRLTESDENPYRSILATAAVLFDRRDFKAGANFDQLDEKSFWLLGLGGLEKYQKIANEKKRQSVVLFPEGGYTVVDYDGEPQQHLVFDHGPVGFAPLAAHGHADALSFTLNVASRPMLIDSGTYLYLGAGKWRSYFRGTSAHNTVVVDGADQSEAIGIFQWGRKANARLQEMSDESDRIILVAEHDGYKRIGVSHQRTIQFIKPDKWIVKDVLSGKDLHRIDLYFHLAPCFYEMKNSDTVFCYFEEFSVLFAIRSDKAFTLDVIEGKESPMMGWHSTGFGVKQPNPVIAIRLYEVLPAKIETTIGISRQTRLLL